MTQEIILDLLIVLNIIMLVAILSRRLKNQAVRTATVIFFGISSVVYLVLAVLNLTGGNITGAFFTVLASAFFSVESCAASKWKVGETFPRFTDWLKIK
jgi:hypothetical protein